MEFSLCWLAPPPLHMEKNHYIFFGFKMLFRHFYNFFIFSPFKTKILRKFFLSSELIIGPGPGPGPELDNRVSSAIGLKFYI